LRESWKVLEIEKPPGSAIPYIQHLLEVPEFKKIIKNKI
jgi:hypothetical protein